MMKRSRFGIRSKALMAMLVLVLVGAAYKTRSSKLGAKLLSLDSIYCWGRMRP
jgi:hypothetical protein